MDTKDIRKIFLKATSFVRTVVAQVSHFPTKISRFLLCTATLFRLWEPIESDDRCPEAKLSTFPTFRTSLKYCALPPQCEILHLKNF